MKQFVLATFLLAAVLPAQRPGGSGFAPRGRGFGPGDPAARAAAVRQYRDLTPLKEALGLTDAQVQQLQDVRKQELEAAKPTLQQMREKAAALGETMRADQPDSAKAGQLMVELKNLRESIRSSRTGLGDKASGVLTPEQKTKLKALDDARKMWPAARQAAALGLIALPEGAGGGLRAPLGRGRAAGGQRLNQELR